MPERYHRIRFRLPVEWEDFLIGELSLYGTLGVETRFAENGRIEADAYFRGEDLEPALDRVRGDWRQHGVELVEVEQERDQDWLAEYRRRAEPIALGRRLVVDPGEPSTGQPEDWSGSRTLRIPARQAFGTGSHESTQLAIRLLEEMPLRGRSVLDVGAGSGILSFASELFGAEFVVGLEIDPVATFAAGENRSLNGLSVSLVAGELGAIGRRAFDVALVNIRADVIIGLVQPLASVLKVGALSVFSGFLRTGSDELTAALSEAGFLSRRKAVAGEWGALLTDFRPPPGT